MPIKNFSAKLKLKNKKFFFKFTKTDDQKGTIKMLHYILIRLLNYSTLFNLNFLKID